MLLFFGLWLFLMRRYADRHGGGFMAIGKSKAKIYMEKDVKITFADVAGVDEAKTDLANIVNEAALLAVRHDKEQVGSAFA